jgi:hypothetical protein
MRKSVVCGKNFHRVDRRGRKICDFLPQRRSQWSKPRIPRSPGDALTNRMIKRTHDLPIRAFPERSQSTEVTTAAIAKPSLAEDERLQARNNAREKTYISKRKDWEKQILGEIDNRLNRRNLIAFPIIITIILISYLKFDMSINTPVPTITLLLTLVIMIPVIVTNKQLYQYMYITEYNSMLSQLSDDERTLEYDFVRAKNNES